MKKVISLFILLLTSFIYGQNEQYKMQELSKNHGVFEMQFKPDQFQKKIISSYMEGETEADSLKFWIEGTHTLQNVMVTVLSPNSEDKIKVDIVKRHWKDTQRSGYTKQGAYQETFNTANKFGIVLTSVQPNIPFKIAVWTSGEIRPQMNNLFVPISNTSSGQNSVGGEKNLIGSLSVSSESNTLLYAIIGLLALIALFLVYIVFKKKSSKTFLVLLALTAGQQSMHADAIGSSAAAFRSLMSKMKFDNFGDFYNTTNDYAQIAQTLIKAVEDGNLLFPDSDRDSQVDIDHAGGPSLESSCVPEKPNANDGRDGINGRDGQDGRDGMDGRDGIDGQDGSDGNGNGNDGDNGQNGTDGNSGNDGDNGSNGNEGNDGNDGNDGDRPKYDDQGRPKYDSNGNPINYDNAKYPKYDKNGKAINYGEIDPKADFDYQGRPKYDAEGQPIDYDTSKYPKYDKNGNAINYGEIDPKADFDYQGRPKYDAEGQPIDYNTSKYPKYDKNGNPINYGQEDVEKSKEKPKTNSGGLVAIDPTVPETIVGLNTEVEEMIIAKAQVAEASMLSFLTIKQVSKADRKDGCACLEEAYSHLNDRRYYFEQLRIIYKNAMANVDAFLTFWDGASGVHGVTAIAWQKYKKDFIPKTKGPLNTAYDNKYEQMIQGLEKTLKDIDECEKMLGNQRWYNQSGFIYYTFMADKYKRN